MLGEENPIWAEKYRPNTVAETILPVATKARFQKFVDDGMVPNLLLSGGPGQGKTTSAKAMLNQLACDYIIINGSLNAGMDTMRHDISLFASSISLLGKRKYVIIDEADQLSRKVQDSMRTLIEEFSSNCGFIFTVNHKEKIVDALRSRLAEVNFAIPPDESPHLAQDFFARIKTILEKEGVGYDKKALAAFLMKYFPDFRRVLTELQTCAAQKGVIDASILTRGASGEIVDVFKFLKAKDFAEMRKWLGENSDIDADEIFQAMYTLGDEYVEAKSMPGFIVTLAEYQYKHAFSANAEINLAACMTEIMYECSFK